MVERTAVPPEYRSVAGRPALAVSRSREGHLPDSTDCAHLLSSVIGESARARELALCHLCSRRILHHHRHRPSGERQPRRSGHCVPRLRLTFFSFLFRDSRHAFRTRPDPQEAITKRLGQSSCQRRRMKCVRVSLAHQTTTTRSVVKPTLRDRCLSDRNSFHAARENDVHRKGYSAKPAEPSTTMAMNPADQRSESPPADGCRAQSQATLGQLINA